MSMKIPEIILDKFIEQTKLIAEQWTRDVSEGKEPMHVYANQIFHIHSIMKNILSEEEPK